MDQIRILLAEDHKILRQGLRRLLEDQEDVNVVGEAANGEEAVTMTADLQPDLVVMDVSMPKLNGVEATRQIKVVRPTTAVLVLSAYDDDEYVFGLLEAGAAGYLLKSASWDDLARAIRAVYKGEPMLDPRIARKVIDRFRARGDSPIAVNGPSGLSKRETEVLTLAASGISNRGIADKLQLSRRTIEGTLRQIFVKLRVGSRTEAAIFALKKGWVTLDDLH